MQELALPQLLERWADKRPSRRFLTIGNEDRTFAEMREEAWRLAAALRERGIGPGDRVAVMAPTSFESIATLFAVAGLGAISVPLNIYLKGEPLVHQLTSSGCATLVADAAGVDMVRGLSGELRSLRFLIEIGLPDDVVAEPVAGLDVLPYATLVRAPATFEPVSLRDRDTYAILYTSGTTGLPKGCVISHGQTKQWNRYTQRLCGLTDEDSLFTAAPLFHVGGQTPLLGALSCGIRIIFESSFSASKYLLRANEVGATIAIGVGWIAQALLKQPPSPLDRDHSLRAMSTVQLSVTEQSEFERRFGVRTLTRQYGQTECYPISYNPFEDQGVSPLAGRPAPEVLVDVHDEDGHGVPVGEVGEIVVRPLSPHVMFERYWEDDAATTEAFRGLWFHTGDMGRIVDGEIQYVDRKKDAMRRRGENVSAFELERTISRAKGVREVAVHGIEVKGEIDQSIKACLVVDDREHFDYPELATFMADELPYFAIPQYIELLDELPRNAAGRVMKDHLRSRGITPSTRDLIAMGLGVTREQRRGSARP